MPTDTRPPSVSKKILWVGYVVSALPVLLLLLSAVITGYLGGATAADVRLGEAFLIPVIAGVLVWAGLYLRDQRVRALIPLRKTAGDV
jgi:hypothetical protein